MSTMTYTGRLTVTSCWCGIHLAIPEDLYDYAHRHKTTVWCPLGHMFVWNDTTEKELEETRARLAQVRRREIATRDLLRHEERSHAATRGHLTRKRKQLVRVKAGVCPCCNRTFQQLARHMKAKHPDFKPEETA